MNKLLKLLVVSVFLGLFLELDIHAQVSKYQVHGMVKYNGELMGRTKINVYEGEQFIDSDKSFDTGYFKFQLYYNRNYTIRFGKPDYLFRTIHISTAVSAKFRAPEEPKMIYVNLQMSDGKENGKELYYVIHPQSGRLIRVDKPKKRSEKVATVDTVEDLGTAKAKQVEKVDKVSKDTIYKRVDKLVDKPKKRTLHSINKEDSDVIDTVDNRQYLSVSTPLLKKDSLLSDFRRSMFNYSLDSEVKALEAYGFPVNKKMLKSYADSLEQMKLETALDSLWYLGTLLQIKQNIVEELRLDLAKQMSAQKRTLELSSLSTVQALLVELEQQVHIIREEISAIRSRLFAQERELEKQRFLLISLLISVILLMGIVMLLYVLYRNKRKSNRILIDKNSIIQQQNEEIQTQHDYILVKNKMLEHQKKEITSSIEYAQRIQQALLPDEYELTRLVSNYFILHLPRDIVSGDFYWVKQVGDLSFVVAADCTGHGVPGAFMSALGIAMLNEISANEKISPAGMLNQLREKIKAALHQTGKLDEAKDGMDLCLCAIDHRSKVLLYSGAYNPLFIIRNRELVIHKADRQPIGIGIKEKSFSEQEVKLCPQDMLYLFSDGYSDQLGEKDDRKFKIGNFKKLLLEICELPLNEQKQRLLTVHQQWRGTVEQTDDILVVGIRV